MQRQELLLQIANVQSELNQQLIWIHEMRNYKQNAMRKMLKKCPYSKIVYTQTNDTYYEEYDGGIFHRMTFWHRILTVLVLFVSFCIISLFIYINLEKEYYYNYFRCLLVGGPIVVCFITRHIFLKLELKSRNKIMKQADEKLDWYCMQITSSAIRISHKCAPLPVKYCYYYPMTTIYGYIRDLRADSLKEAINLFECVLQQNGMKTENLKYADENGKSAEVIELNWR